MSVYLISWLTNIRMILWATYLSGVNDYAENEDKRSSLILKYPKFGDLGTKYRIKLFGAAFHSAPQ